MFSSRFVPKQGEDGRLDILVLDFGQFAFSESSHQTALGRQFKHSLLLPDLYRCYITVMKFFLSAAGFLEFAAD